MIEYLAGFFDGEGCAHVTIREYKGKRTISQYITRTLVVSNNSREVCELFQSELGGNVYQVRSGHYQWRANNTDAIDAAIALMPHIKLKRSQLQQLINGDKVSQLWTKVNADSDKDCYGN
ncbi:MAG: LAGLIDADG family homing endonuclease [Betaproteobacteria bacterium]